MGNSLTMTTETEDYNVVLPPEIWSKILYYAIAGEDVYGPNILYKCRRVCRDWNEIIKKNVWKSPNKKWGLITKAMIEDRWVAGSYLSHKMISHAKDLETKGVLQTGVLKTMAERLTKEIMHLKVRMAENIYNNNITFAASLAHFGLLDPLDILMLSHDNLASIPAQHLSALVSCVMDCVFIRNAIGCDKIVTILESVKST